jgi:hypothetical protein
MALTGNLEVFPLQEVLRMLARSNKTGCLRINAGNTQGRVFIANGALTLATVSPDDAFRSQLINAGLMQDDDLRRLDAEGGNLAEGLNVGASVAELTDFVREHVVESLFRIRRPGSGNFDFMVDVLPRYATGLTFDAEVIAAEAERRASEWADIESVIDDMDAPLVMAGDLPDENSVTVNPTTWRVLASLGAGAAVRNVSDSLGMSLFRAARELSGLVRSGLVEAGASPTPAAAPVMEPETTPSWTESGAESAEIPQWSDHTPAFDEPHADGPSDDWAEASPWLDRDLPAADAGPGDAEPPSWELPATETDEVAAPESADDDIHAGGWWAQATATTEPEGEADDADAFLESVFSQFDEGDATPAEEGDDETGFSMGLLRRRRMGAVSRELTDS